MKKLYIVVGVLLAATLTGCEVDGKKVLVIYSYHPEYPWVQEEKRGIEEAFEGNSLVVRSFYLDTKRNTSREWKEKVAGEAVAKIGEFKPDLVIVCDDNACMLVAEKYRGKGLPFVFCGVNADPRDYRFPAENITGVVEREHVKESVALLKELVPGVKRIAFVMDDNPTSRRVVDRLRSTRLPVEAVEIFQTNDFSDWKAKVKKLGKKVDAIGLFTYETIKKSGGGKRVPPERVLRWTLRNSGLPEFAMLDFTVNGGALCGVVVSGVEQGRAAGGIALDILKGKKPDSIPVASLEKGIRMINAKRADTLGIAIPAVLRED